MRIARLYVTAVLATAAAVAGLAAGVAAILYLSSPDGQEKCRRWQDKLQRFVDEVEPKVETGIREGRRRAADGLEKAGTVVGRWAEGLQTPSEPVIATEEAN